MGLERSKSALNDRGRTGSHFVARFELEELVIDPRKQRHGYVRRRDSSKNRKRPRTQDKRQSFSLLRDPKLTIDFMVL